MLIRIFLLINFFISLSLYSQNKTDEYIDNYSDLAIKEMNLYNIPASITLAQAILESGNGESRLAVEGKNHFGIKCHNWKGNKIYADDDEKNECFRSYASVSQSYNDHSLFLIENKRYASLFLLNISDYKAWAKGLKKAGYATNPKYDKLLIDLIEKYNLSKFDKGANNKTKIYFAHSYGLPYLVGSGLYIDNKSEIFSAEINTSFYLSESNISYHYKLTDRFYAGGGLGVLYMPAFEDKFYPHIQSELIFNYNSLLFKLGSQFIFGDVKYNIIPFFRITYLPY
ncbi:MAG: N-acetylmuramoyl-L-alanine amidase [Flavobacteriales bacterium]|nr:N-acetylmuramoyl-L-alanine amidase [Flavobacteriales bacterium]|tara:strand:+ start:9506 stop:10357 length:852 start_codon:yes stop_codon:yes gene_type:complete